MMTKEQQNWDEYLPFLPMATEDQSVSEVDYVKRMLKKPTYAYDLE